MKKDYSFLTKTVIVLLFLTLFFATGKISAQVPVYTENDLRTAVLNEPTGTTIVVMNDISLTGSNPIVMGAKNLIIESGTTPPSTIYWAGDPNVRHITMALAASTLTLRDIILDGGGIGGGIAVTNGNATTTTLSLVNATIKNCYNTSNGGAISSVQGILDLRGNIVFENNTAVHAGGAIYKATAGSFALTNLTSLKMTDNKAGTTGGAIYTAIALALSKVTNAQMDTISRNTSIGDGGAIYSTVVTTLKNIYFSENRAGYNFNTNKWLTTGNGGAVAMSGNVALTLTDTLIFVNNTAASSGGAINIPGTAASVVGGLVSLKLINNRARLGSGGAINISAASAMALNSTTTSINNNIVTGNIARTNGGAINSAGTLTLRNFYFDDNKAGLDTTGLWLEAGDGGAVAVTTVGLTLNGNMVFTNNIAAGSGGAINKGTTNAITTSGLSSLKLKDNAALTGFGGAINTAFNLTLNGRSAKIDTISGNTAGGSGGAIYCAGVAASTFTMDSVCFYNNRAGYNKITDTEIAGGNGGAIATLATSVNSTNSLVLINTTFIKNVASQNGGAVYVPTPSNTTSATTRNNLTLQQKITFIGNTAGNQGGGIWKGTTGTATTTAVTSLCLKNNTAKTTVGGGIYTAVAMSFTKTGIQEVDTITGNTAGTHGGAFYASAANLTLRNFCFTDNKAAYLITFNPKSGKDTAEWTTTGHGGAIYATSGALTLRGDMTFINNMAGYSGGAICKNNATGAFTVSAPDLTSLILKNNIARNGYGGAIYTLPELNLDGATVNIDTISGNSAGLHGGAVYATGALTFADLCFKNNIAGYSPDTKQWGTGTGGAITITSVALALNGNKMEFVNNMAGGNGGAIDKNNATGAFTASDSTKLVFINNTSRAGRGGAINTLAVTTLGKRTELNMGTLSGNKAGTSGGAIYANTTLTLKNLCFDSNIAGYNSNADTLVPAGNGGAIHAQAGLTLRDTIVFTNNVATGNGGAINKAATAYTFTNTVLTLKNNTAIIGNGGAIQTGVALTLSNTGTLKIDTISGNIAGGSGGAISTSGAFALTFDSLCFKNNRAGYDIRTNTWLPNGNGGAIAATNALTLRNTMSFLNNEAGGNGGAIYKGATGAFEVTATPLLTKLTIDNNSAFNGGGIYSAALLDFPANVDLSITNNTATNNGGGIFTTNDSLYSLLVIRIPAATKQVFSGNTAAFWSLLASKDVPYNSIVFPGAGAQNTFSVPSPYGINNYDVNYRYKTHLVTFEPNNGNPSFSQWVRSGTPIDFNLISHLLFPTFPGQLFSGWYDNSTLTGAPWLSDNLITKDTILYAKYTTELAPPQHYEALGCGKTTVIGGGHDDEEEEEEDPGIITVVSGLFSVIDVLKNNPLVPVPCDISTLTLKVSGFTAAGATASATPDNKILYTFTENTIGKRDTLTYELICSGTGYAGRIFVYVAPCPDNITTASCAGIASMADWDIKLLNSTTDQQPVSTYAIPLVGNVNSFGFVNIIAPIPSPNNNLYTNRLRIFMSDPAGKYVQMSAFQTPWFNMISNPYTIANVDGGQYPAIFIASSFSNNSVTLDQGRIIKYTTTDGIAYTRAWTTATNSVQYTPNATNESPQPMVTNFNGLNVPHLLVYDKVVNAQTGVLLVNGGLLSNAANRFGKGGHPLGTAPTSMMAIADVNGDGIPEVIAGDCVYKVTIASNTGTAGNSFVKILQAADSTTRTDIRDGATAVADMTGDGFVDVIVATAPNASGNSFLYVYNPRTGVILNNNTVSFTGNISIPVVGDIDGDGKPEIFVTSTDLITAFTYDGTDLLPIWQKTIDDPSGTTAATLFDFDEDGKNELVHRDTKFLRIINGMDGTDLVPPVPCGSATGNEYPVIADVNHDGAAEIIVTGGAANSVSGTIKVFSYDAAKSKWAPARKVWNQYAYNAVHINENLTIPVFRMNPAHIFPNGKQPYNAYLRQQSLLDENANPLGLLPNIVWSTEPTITIAGNVATIKGCIRNDGNAALNGPLYVTFYKNDTIAANILAVDNLNKRLMPNELFCFTTKVHNLGSFAPITNLWISVNDSAGYYPYGAQCERDGRRKFPFPTFNFLAAVNSCRDSAVLNVRPLLTAVPCANSTSLIVSSTTTTIGTVTDSTFVYYLPPLLERDTVDFTIDCNGIVLSGKIFIRIIGCPAESSDIIAETEVVCFGDVTTIKVSAPTIEDPVFFWYVSQTAPMPFARGNQYTTGKLSKNVKFYVSVAGKGRLENIPGDRKMVEVIVKPAITILPKRICIDE